MPSTMKQTIFASLITAVTVSAHSWLECTAHDNSELLPWMKGNSTLKPPVIIDPAMPWYSQYCHGWPRNKANPGNWIDESTNYVWNIAANSWNGGSYHPADTHACPPNQRTPTYQANAPMATAAAGGSIRLRYGGNGHARGFNVGGDPGTVTVYWKGGPEREITDISEFTPANALQSAGFAADSFAYPADPNIKTPTQGLVDKGNWMVLNFPSTMAPGRHMFTWVWYYSGAPQWSTCFDVMITGSGSGATSSSSSSSAAAAAAPAAAAPAAVNSPAAAVAAAPASSNTKGKGGAAAAAAAAAPAASSPIVAAAKVIDTASTADAAAASPAPAAAVAPVAAAAAAADAQPASNGAALVSDASGAVSESSTSSTASTQAGRTHGHGFGGNRAQSAHRPHSTVWNEALASRTKRHARDFLGFLHL